MKKHIFTLIMLFCTLLWTVFFSTAALVTASYGQQGYSSVPGTGLFADINTNSGAVAILVTLAVISAISFALTLWVDLDPSVDSSITWLKKTLSKRMGTIRLITGLVLVISSIGISENITGDNPAKDLACAAICMLGLYIGFRNIGFSNLRKRGCYRNFRPDNHQNN